MARFVVAQYGADGKIKAIVDSHELPIPAAGETHVKIDASRPELLGKRFDDAAVVQSKATAEAADVGK